jgi:hypothetical protein
MGSSDYCYEVFCHHEDEPIGQISEYDTSLYPCGAPCLLTFMAAYQPGNGKIQFYAHI